MELKEAKEILKAHKFILEKTFGGFPDDLSVREDGYIISTKTGDEEHKEKLTGLVNVVKQILTKYENEDNFKVVIDERKHFRKYKLFYNGYKILSLNEYDSNEVISIGWTYELYLADYKVVVYKESEKRKIVELIPSYFNGKLPNEYDFVLTTIERSSKNINQFINIK